MSGRVGRGDPAAEALQDNDISFADLLAPLRRRWRLIAATALVTAGLTATVLLLQRAVYTGETTFTPETSSTSLLGGNLAGLAGLIGAAGQLGLGGGSSVSPDFFAEVVDSREIVFATLQAEFPNFRAPGRNARRPLLDLLEVRGDSVAERLQRGMRTLKKKTNVEIDRRTGIVTLAVEMPSAELAADVANYMVQLLNRFNLERRQSQSREQRRFTGERLLTAERELREAERAQLTFLERNRAYRESPLLTYEASRLQRDVQGKQEVFLTLTKAHEEARIAEVRDTPVLTIIDPAVPPVWRTRPRRTLGVLIALVLGALAGVVFAYLADARAARAAALRPDYHRLDDTRPEVRDDSATAPSHA